MTGKPLTHRQQIVYTAMSKMGAKGPLGEWVTADAVGYQLGPLLKPVQRHGNDAVARSWSGYVAHGFVLASTMRSLVGRGLAESRFDPSDPRTKSVYRLTK